MLIKKIVLYILMSCSMVGVLNFSYAKPYVKNLKATYPKKIVKITFLDINKSLYLNDLSLEDIIFVSEKKDIEIENRVFEDGFIEVRIYLKGDYKLKAYNKLIISKNKEIFIDGVPFGVNRYALIDNVGVINWGVLNNHGSFGVKPPPAP